jgi:alkanesulfonate monooxygenase SsuD/methylene tetrahydromethanopterin reductase-like flavin-dependent oxidoreductase (luciferase family)
VSSITWIVAWPPLDGFYEERLKLVEAHDCAGFHGYHVAEHHVTTLGVVPSPGVWLASVAQRTKRLRFGPLVYLLPLYHPIKLLEEICMLDQISGARLLLGSDLASRRSNCATTVWTPNRRRLCTPKRWR